MALKGNVLKSIRACISLAAFLGVHAGSQGKLTADGNVLVGADGEDQQTYLQKGMHEKAMQIYQQTVETVVDSKKREATLWKHLPLRGLSIGDGPSDDIKKTVCACMCACVC